MLNVDLLKVIILSINMRMRPHYKDLRNDYLINKVLNKAYIVPQMHLTKEMTTCKESTHILQIHQTFTNLDKTTW